MSTEKIMLIYVSAEGNGKGGNTGNNNKFYYVELTESGDVITRYGRVGASGQTNISKGGGLSKFKSTVRAKTAKGYIEVPVDNEIDGTEISSGGDIMMIAMDQIKSDIASKDLIKKLVKKNIHNITSNTKITFNVDSGLFKTPLGAISKSGIEKAIEILNDLSVKVNDSGINKGVSEKEVKELSEKYYSIIPTSLTNLRDINNHLINNKKLSDQYDICNALLQTIDIVETQKTKQLDVAKADNKIPTVFDTSLTLLDDKKEFDRIVKYFENSKNKKHGYRTDNAKIERIFKVAIDKDDQSYAKDMSNQMELWHGTKIVNILSILKSGLLMPKQSPGSVTGYMYGQGLYFGNQSSKSLNYCDGMYWNNSSSDDNKIYMFVADVALGNYQVPKSSTSRNPDKGFDSYWAKSGQSGVMNDEIIIFDNKQIRLKYLMEISLK